ncbi:MAG: porin family protein [Bacteroidales bacterium]|nr:porin family protein [Bacteroidales bacterium]MDD3892885.1 porin family protein [Bacteroidales bacterium]
MKRLAFLISTLMVVSLAANAQFLRFGVKGGVSSSTVKIDKTTFSTPDNAQSFIVEQGDSKMGLHFGLFGRIQVLGFYVQPELLFTQSKGEVILTEITNETSPIESIREQKFNKFDIPVIVGWKLGPARIGIGPVASFMLSEKDGLKDKLADVTNETVKSNFKNATFGYQVGVGLDILKFATLDVRYEGNLSKLGDGVNIAGKHHRFDQRNPQWIFSLGIFF